MKPEMVTLNKQKLIWTGKKKNSNKHKFGVNTRFDMNQELFRIDDSQKPQKYVMGVKLKERR